MIRTGRFPRARNITLALVYDVCQGLKGYASVRRVHTNSVKFFGYLLDRVFTVAKLLLGNPVVDVTLFKIEFCTKICVGFLGTYP